MTTNLKSGFVTLLGPPNAGKSSLLNCIMAFHLAIVTPLVQTTRHSIKGIYDSPRGQIVFIDTPGIHDTRQKLGQLMNDVAWSSKVGSDLVLFMHPLDQPVNVNDQNVISRLNLNQSVALISKLDLGNAQTAKKRAAQFKQLGFKTVIGVAISMHDSIDHLLNFIYDQLPTQPPFYDPDQITDRPMRFIAQELIRETVIENTFQEVPYESTVVIDQFQERPSANRIWAHIYVARESQKLIMIGKAGSKIDTIIKSAAQKMARAMNKKVYLQLKVKVSKNWVRDEKIIKKLGLGF